MFFIIGQRVYYIFYLDKTTLIASEINQCIKRKRKRKLKINWVILKCW